jgi:hypothetical protein
VGRLAGRIAERQFDDTRRHVLAERLDARGPRLVAQEAIDAFRGERSCQR